MQNDTATQQNNGQSMAVASLVLGIFTILTSFIIFLSIVLGILAIILGVISLKSAGRGKAMAGIITGSVGIVFSLLFVLVVFLAVPLLQKNSRDASRKNDVMKIASDIADYQANNSGLLPVLGQLSADNLVIVTQIVDSGAPTESIALFGVGQSCDGQMSTEDYSVRILLENGAEYCAGS